MKILYGWNHSSGSLNCSDAVTTLPKAAALIGRTLLDVGRYGKHFYLTLDGPKHPVLHLGMTGAIQVGWLSFYMTAYPTNVGSID